MKVVFNESTLQRFNKFALPLVLAWSLSTAGSLFLPSSTTEGFTSEFDPFFDLFHFGEKFGLTNQSSSISQSKTVTKQTLVPDPHRIKAIYRSNSDSFISISDSKTTTVVPLGGKYKNFFQLISVGDKTATFSGFGKKYTLRLGHDDPLARQEMVSEAISDPSSNIKMNEWHTIKHEAVMAQMNNIQNITKSIDIAEVFNGTKIDGFRVNRVDSDSLFVQLGILNGDIIQSVNNKKLSSYADVLSIYSQIPHLRSIRITVLRNNLPKDIVYEITR
ncbi:MAG: hypothetical protein PHW18_01985 [Sulfuricurvum sp.]|uniref:hypothetical protein n=1 Tax=Sulfuricurvum sp. TaxID=2025608 RepID=UPI00262E109E|nr:hypothetical protein [Sulfuricurvum sp.]MDD2828325.1 hypothetical protein [Sulfuricurvum sp.]MDD4949720.1 hypothetical protein [Sulfuricurvum sp.]